MATRRRWLWRTALVCLAGSLGSCSSVLTEGSSAGAGIGGATIAHAVTDNAGVTTGIGLAVQAGALAGLQYAERRVHQTEQNQIAAVAGGLPVGAVAGWNVVHTVPIEANQHGEVTVTRAFSGKGFACKQIVFSVDRHAAHGTQHAFYVASVCFDGTRWKWATAEPATERWGALQ